MPDPDFDHHGFTAPEAAYAAYDRLRRDCPAAHSPHYGGFHVVTRHADVRAAAAEPATFSSATGHMLPEPGWPMLPPIDFDPPEHTRWRRVFRDLFDASARRRVETEVRSAARELIDGFVDRGACDLVTEYAEPIPVLAIAHLVGLDPAKAPVMRRLVLDAYARTADRIAFDRVFAPLADFIMAEVNARRTHPRDDFLTKLGNEEFDGAKLTDDEVMGVCLSILGGGHHSTTSALASALSQLAADARLRARVVGDRRLVPRLIEESIRLHTPLHSFRRRTRRDATIGDTSIPPGEDLLLVFAAANRDPLAFRDADTFDIDRPESSHLGFGYGIHSCVGAPVARLELRVAIDELLDRIPDVHLGDDHPSRAFIGGKLDMIKALPVAFTPGGLPPVAAREQALHRR